MLIVMGCKEGNIELSINCQHIYEINSFKSSFNINPAVAVL